jgi:hypothetical protein
VPAHARARAAFAAHSVEPDADTLRAAAWLEAACSDGGWPRELAFGGALLEGTWDGNLAREWLQALYSGGARGALCESGRVRLWVRADA